MANKYQKAPQGWIISRNYKFYQGEKAWLITPGKKNRVVTIVFIDDLGLEPGWRDYGFTYKVKDESGAVFPAEERCLQKMEKR